MSVWLDTRGKSTLAIGICGRCSRKFSMTDLMPDPNYPGLLVCKDDKDDFDPYRLAPRAPDNITLQFVRPDTPIGTDPDGMTTESDSYFLITEDGDYYLITTIDGVEVLTDADGNVLTDADGNPLEPG